MPQGFNKWRDFRKKYLKKLNRVRKVVTERIKRRGRRRRKKMKMMSLNYETFVFRRD